MAKSFADSVAPANDATNLNNFFLKKLAFKNLTSSSTVASVNTNDDIKGNHRIRKFNHPRLESSDGDDDDCDNQVSEANATKEISGMQTGSDLKQCIEVLPFLRYCIGSLLTHMEESDYEASMNVGNQPQSTSWELIFSTNMVMHEISAKHWHQLNDLAQRITSAFKMKTSMELQTEKVKRSFKMLPSGDLRRIKSDRHQGHGDLMFPHLEFNKPGTVQSGSSEYMPCAIEHNGGYESNALEDSDGYKPRFATIATTTGSSDGSDGGPINDDGSPDEESIDDTSTTNEDFTFRITIPSDVLGDAETRSDVHVKDDVRERDIHGEPKFSINELHDGRKNNIYNGGNATSRSARIGKPGSKVDESERRRSHHGFDGVDNHEHRERSRRERSARFIDETRGHDGYKDAVDCVPRGWHDSVAPYKFNRGRGRGRSRGRGRARGGSRSRGRNRNHFNASPPRYWNSGNRGDFPKDRKYNYGALDDVGSSTYIPRHAPAWWENKEMLSRRTRRFESMGCGDVERRSNGRRDINVHHQHHRRQHHVHNDVRSEGFGTKRPFEQLAVGGDSSGNQHSGQKRRRGNEDYTRENGSGKDDALNWNEKKTSWAGIKTIIQKVNNKSKQENGDGDEDGKSPSEITKMMMDRLPSLRRDVVNVTSDLIESNNSCETKNGKHDSDLENVLNQSLSFYTKEFESEETGDGSIEIGDSGSDESGETSNGIL